MRYKKLVDAIWHSVAIQCDAETTETERGRCFDEAICRCLAAISIIHHNIVIEVDETDGFGPDHVLPWLEAAREALKRIGGDRSLAIATAPPSVSQHERPL